MRRPEEAASEIPSDTIELAGNVPRSVFCRLAAEMTLKQSRQGAEDSRSGRSQASTQVIRGKPALSLTEPAMLLAQPSGSELCQSMREQHCSTV